MCGAGDQSIGLSGQLAGHTGGEGTSGAPHCHAGFPYSVSGVHSGSQEKLFRSSSAHSVFGSSSGLGSESCVFVPTEEGRIQSLSGMVSFGARHAFLFVPVVIWVSIATPKEGFGQQCKVQCISIT